MFFTFRKFNIGVYVYGRETLHRIEVQSNSSGLGLFQAIKNICKVPIEKQLLLHQGKLIEPHKSLPSQGIVENSTVFLMVKGKGGGKTLNSSFQSGSY